MSQINLDESPSLQCRDISQLINIVKQFGAPIGKIFRDDREIEQISFNFQYLAKTLNIIFEFDMFKQHIGCVFYNNATTQEKKYLEIILSINDIPYLKYIENDKSDIIPTYQDDHIQLGGGEYLMHFAHSLLFFIGYNNCRLDDDSHLKLDVRLRIKLWLYLLIKNGKSWYRKFGYLPATVSVTEYNLIIEDMRKIKLMDIKESIMKVRELNRLSELSELSKLSFGTLKDVLLLSVETLYGLLEGCSPTETIYDYIMNRDICASAVLLNEITQSVYSRSYEFIITREKETFVIPEKSQENSLEIPEKSFEIPEKSLENPEKSPEKSQEIPEKSQEIPEKSLEISEKSLEISEKMIDIQMPAGTLSNTGENRDEPSDDEEDVYPNPNLIYETYMITFNWYTIYSKLMIANVMQTNNDITDHFYRLQCKVVSNDNDLDESEEDEPEPVESEPVEPEEEFEPIEPAEEFSNSTRIVGSSHNLDSFFPCWREECQGGCQEESLIGCIRYSISMTISIESGAT